jgi:hypothetical protein
MKMHRLAALAAAMGIVLLAPAAVAQDESTRPSPSPADGSYLYRFEDDPLSATGLEVSFPIISVRNRADRATLIRPRTAFVVELLKSVEKL